MKKLFFFLLCLMMLFNNIKEVKVNEYYAKSYVVIEKDSKRILEGKDYYETQSVASISKLMTFYVAHKYMDLDHIVTVGEEIHTIVGSAVYLVEGEQITLYELLVALLLRSANDAAVVIAKYVGGSIDNFIKLMNLEAKKLGMNNTIFNNPHGLDEFDEGNISCAYDMVILLSELLNNPLFLKIENIKKYNSSNHGVWFNKNKLMKQYKYSTSCKTGFTKKANRTLISSAKKGNEELIICTLKCSNDFAFHKDLYEYYFDNYSNKVVLSAGELIINNYVFNIDETIYYYLPKKEWKEYKVIYYLNTIDNILEVYLDNKIESIFISKYKSNEIRYW